MSVQASSAVWRHSESKGTERLVLLALADEASDAGEVSAYRRSQAWIAEKVNVGRVETVRRAVRALEELGELAVTLTGRGQTPSNYRLLLPGLREPTGEGGQSPPSGGRRAPQRGGADDGDTSSTDTRSSRSARDADAVVLELCEYLATKMEEHRQGDRPKVTRQWVIEMDRLMRLGPKDLANPEPLSGDRIRQGIDVLFAELSELSGDGFCWAGVIKSPTKLREHWSDLRDALRKQRARRVGKGAAAIERNAARRNGQVPQREPLFPPALGKGKAIDTKEVGR